MFVQAASFLAAYFFGFFISILQSSINSTFTTEIPTLFYKLQLGTKRDFDIISCTGVRLSE